MNFHCWFTPNTIDGLLFAFLRVCFIWKYFYRCIV